MTDAPTPSTNPDPSTQAADPTQAAQAADAAFALLDMTLGHLYSSALRAAAAHRIADHLSEGPLGAEELATRSGTHASSLRRVLRLLSMRGIFREDEHGAFHLTPAAALLAESAPGSQRDGILFLTAESMTRSFAGLDETVRTGVPGFEAAYGTPYFDYVATSAAEQELFDRGMAAFSGPVDEVVSAAYPFPASGTVVDVGGGRGGFLRSVLTRNPGLSGVLFDQPHTVAEHTLDSKDLAGRWRAESGDFFAAVPEGGDVYVLKHILHDWNDDEALRILRAVRTAIAPGGRLVAVDTVLPAGNDPHPGKALDIVMLAALKGRERTEAEFGALFAQAGFRLTRVVPTPTVPSLVEAEPV
ncbi:methyltransferase [Streptomyces sp. NPDC059009]|uniref:methyltransferase n=1 Tax=Streptomyces sp. NPDC059009 TaxID=3346694 RepID=UPI00369E7A4C